MTQLLSGLWWQSMPELHVASSDTRKHAKAHKMSLNNALRLADLSVSNTNLFSKTNTVEVTAIM